MAPMDQLDDYMDDFNKLKPCVERGDGGGVAATPNPRPVDNEIVDKTKNSSPVPDADFDVGRKAWIDR